MTQHKPTALIFRKSILPYSETFIAQQGLNLDTYRAVFCGYRHDNSGLFLLAQAERIVLDGYARFPAISKLRWQSGLPINKAWYAAIKKTNPSLIHAHFIKDGVDAMRLADALAVPLVVTAHGHDITKHDVSRRDLKRRKELFGRVDRMIAVSDYIKRKLLESGCPDHKIVYHSIGIDTGRFDEHKNESDRPSIVFVGRLVEKKGCIYLLQALHKLHNPSIKLTVVGDGPLKTNLTEYANRHGIDADFVGKKHPDEVKALVRQAWIFSVPSITANDGNAEGLGMVFLEAQAMRTPVVSFSSGGVVEAVEHGKSGLLCTERNADALADNIRTLLENSTIRRAFGAYGRSRVVERFDLRKQCKLLETIYSSLL